MLDEGIKGRENRLIDEWIHLFSIVVMLGRKIEYVKNTY
ncbi:hypothetical protein AsAng_0001150 [Aureispira anguillae]|uniref:Uncharacterized protein n=1 Tax=Aureispira anguillae TaxID=2864201 RepID=A0A915VJY5_9BACT|nr:hypothetical protein AsAng_0001150 [Aureispira anguillae]